MLENLFRASLFKDLPLVHEHHHVGHGTGKAHFMGHADHGHAVAGKVHHDIQHFAHHFRIQRRSGLVEEHELRLHGQGAGNGHALLLTAGKHGGVDVRLVADAHLLQQHQRSVLGLLAGHTAQFARGHGKVLQHGLVREQIELLEDHAQILTDLVDVVLRIVHINAVHGNKPAVDFLKPVDGTQQRGLAGPGRAYDDHALPLIHMQGDILQGGQFSKEFPHMFDADDGVRIICVCHSSSAWIPEC